MHEYFKIFGLWVYIIEKYEQPMKDNAGQEKYVKVYDLICMVWDIYIEGNAFNDIKNIFNTKITWITSKTNLKSWRFRYHNDIFRKFNSITLFFYKNLNKYISKF